MNVRVRVLSLSLFLLFLGAIAAHAQVINGCVGQNGALRILVGSDGCRSSEVPISWNAVGPQGPAGSTGANGRDGRDGVAGRDGAPGQPGPPGSSTPPPVIVGSIKFENDAPIDIYDAGGGFENVFTFGGGGGAGAGKVTFKSFTFKKKIDASSPVLFTKCATGTHFEKVLISLHRASGGDATVELGLAFVSDIKYGPAPSPVASLEEIALQAGKVKVTADGASSCWNVVTNTAGCP